MGNTTQRVGGQAVLEGVMMRAGDRMAVAVRDLNGEIQIKKEKVSSWEIAGLSCAGQSFVGQLEWLNH